MANPTMTLIASHTTASGGEASFTFSSIPQTYTDLVLKLSLRDNYGGLTDSSYIQLNGVTTTQYRAVLYGATNGVTGGSQGSVTGFDDFTNGASASANLFSITQVRVQNYTSSNYKGISLDTVSMVYSGTSIGEIMAGHWQSTSPITSIKIISSHSSTYQQYSSFNLYGISNT